MSERKTILVVDDEPRSRYGLKKTLAETYRVICAENGKQALKRLSEQPVDLVITDIRMPEMTGLRLVHQLTRLEWKPAILIVSAYSDFSYAQKAIQFGVSGYLLKPVSKKKLFQEVEKALKEKAVKDREKLYARIMDDKLVRIHQKMAQLSNPLQKALHFIDERLNEKLTLNRVAEHVHLNKNYFSTLFKEQTGVTFHEYVTRSRLELAKSLLLSTDLTVTEIADETGYNNTKHFVETFKKMEGKTPTAFRIKHRPNLNISE